jgi:glycosyltransferase involved in cell wall biosynthesis
VIITLITGGAPHYEAGLISGLIEQEVALEVIGGDDLASAKVMRHPLVRFSNVYRSSPRGSAFRRLKHVAAAYLALLRHACRAKSRLIHIQWNYKLPLLDRTVLNLVYKTLGKKLVYTAHNIDAAARDERQSFANRFSLYFQYRIVDRIIVHTARMKSELVAQYGVNESKISIIPHGIMSSVPMSSMVRAEARRMLGVPDSARVILFFGLIAPYKGVEFLVDAFARLCDQDRSCLLVIAGRVKECPEYWAQVRGALDRLRLKDRVVLRIGHVPDESVEVFFKAADVLALPYRNIFQSGVLYLAYQFGLPVVATDVGSFRQELSEACAGSVCKVDDSEEFSRAIAGYFQSDLFLNLETGERIRIREYATQRYSWTVIGEQTRRLYEEVLAA